MFRSLAALPLLGTQRGIWMAQARDPNSAAYNTGRYLDVPVRLDAERFVAAVESIAACHDVLRVRLTEVDGQPAQQVLDHAPWHPQVVDLSDQPDPLAAALTHMRDDMGRTRSLRGVVGEPDDLVSEVLFQLTPAGVEPGRSLWYQRAHHILTDGVGHSLLFSQIARAYDGRAPKPGPSLQQLVEAEQAEAADDDALSFWRSQRGDAPASPQLSTPTSTTSGVGPAPVAPAPSHVRRSDLLSPEAFEQLEATAEDCGGSWVDAVTVAAADLTAGLTDADDATLGFPLMRRTSSLWRHTPAPRVTVLPLHVTLGEAAKTGCLSLCDAIAHTRHLVREASRHQQLLGEDLRAEAGLRPDDRLFGPQLNVKPFHDDLRVAGAPTRMIDLSAGPVDDLTISVYPLQGGLHIDVDGNPNRHTAVEVERLLARLVQRLTQLAAQSPAAPLIDARTPEARATSLLLDDERAQLARWNSTGHETPATTLPRLVTECAAEHPQRIAVADDEHSLTFKAFDQAVDAAAARLRALGVRQGEVVGVHLPRSVRLLVAVHAVMRCGAVYLPLDVEYPPKRLANMLEDARATAVIALHGDAAPQPTKGPAPRVLLADDLLAGAAGTAAASRRDIADTTQPGTDTTESHDASGHSTSVHSTSGHGSSGHGSSGQGASAHGSGAPAVTPDALAYVLFTSGSTGRPKGVQISHRSLASRLLWMRDFCDVTETDVVLHKTPIGFDVSLWELTLPFVCGARLQVAAPGAHRDPEQLAGVIERSGVTMAHFVPTMLQTLLAVLDDAQLREALASLRVVVCSGEALPPDLALRLREVSDARLLNLYGPTEATIDVTAFDCTELSDDQLRTATDLPIGAPVWNTTLHVLDPFGREVPPGAPGELYLGGVQVAHGYIGRPELTEQRFITLSPDIGRCYATGDRARWEPLRWAEPSGASAGMTDAPLVSAPGAAPDSASAAALAHTSPQTGRPARLHFLGRRDGQVKLHGQRLELAEVERAISGPHLIESAARLHETANGDHMLVGYVVGDEQTVAEALERCRSVLPTFMVPATMMPLDRLPLSPSGKLDRRALPAPTQTSAGLRAADDLERGILRAFVSVLGADAAGVETEDGEGDAADAAFGVTDDFFAWGGTSISSVTLLAELRRTGLPIELGDIFATPTVRALAQVVRGRKAGSAAGSRGYAPVLRLTGASADADAGCGAGATDGPSSGVSSGAESPSWIMVHPAGGLAWPYRRLAQHLDAPAIGLQAAAYLGAEPSTSLRATADEYALRVIEVAAGRPIRLLGWSVGGVIAQDVCAALEAAGHEVELLVLLDSYPGPVWRDQPAPGEADAALALVRMAGLTPQEIEQTDNASLDIDEVVRVLQQRRHPLGQLGAERLHTMRELVQAHSQMLHTAEHRISHAPTIFVEASGPGHQLWQDPTAWQPWLAGPVDLQQLPVGHEQLVIEPYAARIAETIAEADLLVACEQAR
ncbi:MAG: amino acid adenylation domain-containing protein [Pseudoclavibacter sp.]